MNYFEVVERTTGAKMSHTRSGEMMGTTLFSSSDEASRWLVGAGLSGRTHRIEPVYVMPAGEKPRP